MIRYAWRSLRHRPAYALMCIALLVIGVGTASAIFSIVDVALLRPMPYLQPERLFWLQVHEPSAHDSGTTSGLVPLQLTRWRNEHDAFNGLEGVQPSAATLTGQGDPEVLRSLQVSAGLFRVLGVAPARGRPFTTDEEKTGSTVAIISDEFWRSHLASNPAVIGTGIVLDGVQRTIVGVMPRDFTVFFVPTDVYVPMPLEPAALASTYRAIIAVGRARDGVTIPQAVTALNRLNDAIALEAPYFRRSRATVQPLREALFGSDRPALLVVVAAVLLLLVIAASNVMNLTLSDAIARRPATTTRLALGARPLQLMLARLMESSILVVIASIGGLGLGRLTIATLRGINPSFFDGLGPLSLDARTIAFTAMVGAVVGVLSSLPAAIGESRLDVDGIAGAGVRAVGSRREHRIRELLLAGQVTIAVVLLLAASLLIRNLQALSGAPQGFDANNLVAIRIPAQTSVVSPLERANYLARAVDAVRGVPGVTAASASQVQFALGSSSRTFLAIDGVVMPDSSGIVVNIRHTLPDLLPVMGLHLRDGRMLDATDRDGGAPVAVVNASFARIYLGGHGIGTRVRRTASPQFPWMQVVGIVDDAMDAGLGIPMGPTIYVPYLQENQALVTMTILVRLRDGLPVPERALRNAIIGINPSQAINRVVRVVDLERESTSQPKFQALVVTFFGIGAMLLVIGGIYAMTWHTVLRRRRELGLRAALGARPNTLVADSVRRGLRPVVLGIGAALVVSWPAIKLMQRALHQTIHVTDLALLGVVLVGVAAATCVAALVPARRALQIPPSVALQS